MNPALKTIAKPYKAFDGSVTFYMLPYSPMAYQEALRRLTNENVLEIREGRYFGAIESLYWINGITHTVAIEFDDSVELSLEVNSLKVYWQSKPLDICKSWYLAVSMLAEGVCEEWQNAYEATRGGSASEEERDTGDDDPKGASGTS